MYSIGRPRSSVPGAGTGKVTVTRCGKVNCSDRSPRPAQHAKRSQRIPAARLAGASFHLEVDRTRMRVLEWPAPVTMTLAVHQIDRVDDALVRCDARPAQVVESPQDVVVPSRRK